MTLALDQDFKARTMWSIEDAMQLSQKQTHELFCKHINPGLGKIMSLLGFVDRRPVKADGLYIYLEDGSRKLDFTSHYSVVGIGHNHPRVLAARQKWAQEQQLEIWKFFPSPYQAALARNLAVLFPGDLDVVFFCSSGAEANEGALKLASKAKGAARDLVAYTDLSFHGKTHATLSVSGSEEKTNKSFKLLEGCIKIPYGDADELERIILKNKPLIGRSRVSTFIVEAIRSEGVHLPPSDYGQRIRAICDKYDVALIMDEIFTGFGRTGKMFAFEHYDIVPDIVSFSKAIGGAKATFGGFIARQDLFQKAYGSMKDATLHSTTYNGYGEEIVAALEVLNIIEDESLVENAEQQGRYLLSRLQELGERHSVIKDVRGIGLLCCIQFHNIASRLSKLMPIGNADAMINKLTTITIMEKLYCDHDILTYVPLHEVDTIFVTPPLIVDRASIDRFVDALDAVLQTNLLSRSSTLLRKYAVDSRKIA